jgi:hypothetical protein
MTYLDKCGELEDKIKHCINHSDEIDLNVVKEWNELIGDIYGQIKDWDDEYIVTT